jgi:hypothetical protein
LSQRNLTKKVVPKKLDQKSCPKETRQKIVQCKSAPNQPFPKKPTPTMSSKNKTFPFIPLKKMQL